MEVIEEGDKKKKKKKEVKPLTFLTPAEDCYVKEASKEY